MAKFKNKYRIESARWQHWDYSWAGAYFITICTKNRENFFGSVVDGHVRLSPVGAIADVLWHEIKHHADGVESGEFIVMPNHIHGILILDGTGGETGDDNDSGSDFKSGTGTGHVETRHALSLPPPDNAPPPSPRTIGQKRFQNQGKNTVSSIIGGYKSAVTRHARRMGFEFGWQARFWDHVIRNEAEHRRIAHYIVENARKWENDKLNGGKGNVVMEPPTAYGEQDWMV